MTPSGERGFPNALSAKMAALARPDTASYAIIEQHRPKHEFAWVGPVDLVLARLPAAMMAGITLVEWGQR